MSTEEGNGKPLNSSLKNPLNSMKKQKDMTPETEPPRSIGVHDTGGEQIKSSGKMKRLG